MAVTLGFSVPEELKQKVDAYSDSWTKENGGNKADFLKAMFTAIQTERAKAELTGRADEIEHVESLLDGLRTAYMGSLAMAKSARSEALQASAAEVDRLKSANDTLQTHLTDLKAKLEASKADVVNVRSELTALFQGQIREAHEKAKSFEVQAREAESIKHENVELKEKLKASEEEKADISNRLASLNEQIDKARADHQAELDQLHGRYAEKLEVAMAKAENEKNAAIIKIQQEAEAKLEDMRQKMRAEMEDYAKKLKALSSNVSGEKKGKA